MAAASAATVPGGQETPINKLTMSAALGRPRRRTQQGRASRASGTQAANRAPSDLRAHTARRDFRSKYVSPHATLRQHTWQRVAMPGAEPPGSKKSAQIVGRLLGGALEAEGGDKPPVFVHQIDERGMIHRVVAAIKRYLLEIHMIRLGDRRDRRQVARQSDETRIEGRQIILECV